MSVVIYILQIRKLSSGIVKSVIHVHNVKSEFEFGFISFPLHHFVICGPINVLHSNIVNV